MGGGAGRAKDRAGVVGGVRRCPRAAGDARRRGAHPPVRPIPAPAALHLLVLLSPPRRHRPPSLQGGLRRHSQPCLGPGSPREVGRCRWLQPLTFIQRLPLRSPAPGTWAPAGTGCRLPLTPARTWHQGLKHQLPPLLVFILIPIFTRRSNGSFGPLPFWWSF